MSDEICILFGEDGKAHAYNSEFDVTIHCENEREMNDAVALLNLANRLHWRKTDLTPPTEEDADEHGKVLAVEECGAFEGAVETWDFDTVAQFPDPEIMLGYLEGSDFCLLHRFDDRLDCEVLRIHDNQSTDEDSCEDVNKILQVVEFCRHANEVILSEQKDLRNPPDEYVRDLRKDEAILDRLYRASVDAVAYANLHRLERIFKKKASEA